MTMEAQTVFAILVGVGLACFSLFMVGYSFFRGNEARRTESIASVSENDGVSVDAIMDAIDTLDLEYQLGNVTEEQFRQQMQAYRLQVAMAVKTQLEQGDASPELVLEQDVLRARGEGTGDWHSCPQCDAPLPKSADERGRMATCPHCDSDLDIDHSESVQDSPGTPLPAQTE